MPGDTRNYDAVGRLLNHGGPPKPRFTTPEPQEWRSQAACIGQADLFFLERGDSPGRGHPHPTKAICAQCPVTQPCLDYAIATGSLHGVWGGLTYQERRNYVRKRRRAS